MKAKMVWTLAVLTCVFANVQMPQAAEPGKDGPSVSIGTKLEEAEAKNKLADPHFGYVGQLGTFAALAKSAGNHEPMAAIVVHHYPHEDQLALGCTKLKYQGAKRVAGVDGYVFTTDWDGKNYPSKVFLSAEKVYFGGGMQAYIAADYRTETGWTWKMLPLRRMELTTGIPGAAGAADRLIYYAQPGHIAHAPVVRVLFHTHRGPLRREHILDLLPISLTCQQVHSAAGPAPTGPLLQPDLANMLDRA